MHNNIQHASLNPLSTTTRQTGVNQFQLREHNVTQQARELGNAQLDALKSSPLYSPHSAKARSLQHKQHITARTCPFETTFDDKERRFSMYNGDRRLQLTSEFRHMDSLGESDDKRLSAEAESLYKELLPLPDDVRRKQDLVEKLERLLNEQWPGKDFTVHAFGSTENLLATRNSDLDVCIETDWTGFEQQVCQLSRFMSDCGMQKVVCRAQAKVPVVTIYDPQLRVSCDMNINNMLALRNTRLVKTYVQIDVRARKLIFAIKHWANNRALSEAVCNTLTSYTWTLLIVNYLQTRKDAPVLPSLQEWPHEPLPPMDGIDVSFADDIDKYDTLKTFPVQNTESVGSLLFGFFHYYSYVFNYNRDVASVRLGQVLSRREKGYPSDNMFCVEEPFTTSRNLGNTADMGSFKGIHMELQRAHRLLANGESLDVVFAKYDPSKINITPPRLNKRNTSQTKRHVSCSTNRQPRPCQSAELKQSISTPGAHSSSFNQEGRPTACASSPPYHKANPEPHMSNVDQLQWQYVTMAEHNRLVLNSNPYLYPAQLMQYAQAYCQKDLRQPQLMQRARSVPVGAMHGPHWQPADSRRRFSESLQAGQRGRLPQATRLRGQNFITQYVPQFSVSEPELSRPSYNPSARTDLATALGLRQIEMIPQAFSPTKHEKDGMLQYEPSLDGTTQIDMSCSDVSDTQSSIGMTLASSRSSPNSMNGHSSPVMPTYAQVFSGAVDSSLRPPPPFSLNQKSNEGSVVSAHFSHPQMSEAQATPRAMKSINSAKDGRGQSVSAIPISYAAKASLTPPRTVQLRDKASGRI